MESDIKRDISKVSDTLLQVRLENYEYHSSESIEEAIIELQRRGKVFTDEELNTLRNPPPSPPKDNIYTGVPVIHPGWKTRNYRNNVVKDAESPEFYSQGAINAFCILFGVVFGGAMLAANVKKAGHNNIGKWIMLFGAAFTITEIFLFNYLNTGTSLTFIGNLSGALILDFLWHRYIGYNTLYRAKKIWKPLIIAFLIYIPIILLIIYGG